MVAEDEAGQKVIIENQLEKSNHDHLGKLITYLAALQAKAAVWIVSEPRSEHVTAVSWLNDSSSADFYLIKVEAVRIGMSPAAPLLTLIVGPSAETEAVSRSKRAFAERYSIRNKWWTRLVTQPDAKLHKHITPGDYSWIGTTAGVRGLNLNYVVTQDECGAELYIDRGAGAEAENKRIFDELFCTPGRKSMARLAVHFFGNVSIQNGPLRIKAVVPGGYRVPEEDWPAIQAAQIAAMNGLQPAIQPYLKVLRIGG